MSQRSIYLKKNHQLLLTVEISPFGELPEGVEFNTQEHCFQIRVYDGKKLVGDLLVNNYTQKIYAYTVSVQEKYRRLGIATAMYDLAEELSGGKQILPNEYQNEEAESSDDAVEFWRTRGMNLSGGSKFFD